MNAIKSSKIINDAVKSVPVEKRDAYRSYLLGALTGVVTPDQARSAVDVANFCFTEYTH